MKKDESMLFAFRLSEPVNPAFAQAGRYDPELQVWVATHGSPVAGTTNPTGVTTQPPTGLPTRLGPDINGNYSEDPDPSPLNDDTTDPSDTC